MITLPCPCGKTLSLDDKQAGLRVKCDACGREIPVPTPVTKPSPSMALPPNMAMPPGFSDAEKKELPQNENPKKEDVPTGEKAASLAEEKKPAAASEQTVDIAPAVKELSKSAPALPLGMAMPPEKKTGAAAEQTLDITPTVKEASEIPRKTPSKAPPPPESSRKVEASDVSGKSGVMQRAAKEDTYGTHRVLRAHARGGMGQVSVARDENLRREVALKELFPKALENESAVRRFADEAEITAGLEHPGIVPIHACGTSADGRPYYTMKFVRGKTLQEAIKKYHSLPEAGPEKPTMLRELVRRLASVCRTMAFAHEKGIIHRDLKPANIMLGEHDETLVMDWGLAKPYAVPDETLGYMAAEMLDSRPDITLVGSVVGTLSCMSPEQASGDSKTVGPKSDVYSLGAILYQLLCDSPPYTGKSSLDTVQKILKENLPPPSSKHKDVPKRLEAICLRAMMRKPTDRYRDAGKMADDLIHWLEDEPIAAQPDTRGDRAWRWMRKNRTLAMMIFASALLFLLVFGVGGMTVQQLRMQTVAARMTADEMKRRAEEALAQAAKLETELHAKDAELAEKQKELANANRTSDERKALQLQIKNLRAEKETLRLEIHRLRVAASVYAGEETMPGDDDAEKNTQPLLFNINQMVKDFQVKVDAFEPTLEGTSIEKMFDLETNGPAEIDATQASVTLAFPFFQTMHGVRFWFSNTDFPGYFQIESADTAEDLENQTGSYALLMPRRESIAGHGYQETIAEFSRPTELRIIRLTFWRDKNVGVCALRIWGVPNLDVVEREPPPEDFDVVEVEDGVEITKYKGDYQGIIIPKRINGEKVVGLGGHFLEGNRRVASIVTQDTLKRIQGDAFYMAWNLRRVWFSRTVNSINPWAFHWFPTPQTIGLAEDNPHFVCDNGVLFTRDKTRLLIYPCSKMETSFTFPPTVEQIDVQAFRNSNVTIITFPINLRVIEHQAFYHATSLKTVHIPAEATEINFNGFAWLGGHCCPLLENFIVDSENEHLKDIDGVLFSKDGKALIRYPHGKTMTEYTVPTEVEQIIDHAFLSSNHLIAMTIPPNVQALHQRVFGGCSSLKTVHIGAGVSGINRLAFDDCISLEEFTIDPNSKHFVAINGILFSKDQKAIVRYPPGKLAATYTIPNGIEYVGDGAFACSQHLKNIRIPNGVKGLGECAFEKCQALESMVIPDSVTSVGAMLFFCSKRLKSATISVSITNMEHMMFMGCDSLSSIRLPESIDHIGWSTFDSCYGLTSIVIPKSVTKIDTGGFSSCGNLADVTILGNPDIVDHAFDHCNHNIMTITAQKGTKAEAYAKEKGIKLVELK